MHNAPSYVLLEAVYYFIFTYYPYKLWYGFFAKNDKTNIFSFKSVSNLKNFVIIISLMACLIFIIQGFGNINLLIDSQLLISDLAILFNLFSIAVMLGLCLIQIFDYLGISVYYPGKNEKFYSLFYSKKLFNLDIHFEKIVVISFFTFLILGLILKLYFYDFYYLMVLSFIFYIFKPLNRFEKTNKETHFSLNIKKNTLPLFKSILFFAIFIFAVVWLIVFLSSYNGIFYSFGLDRALISLMYSGITTIIGVMFMLAILYYLEKAFTNPLVDISNLLTDYVENKFNVLNFKEDYLKKFDFYLSQKTEIGMVSRSVFHLFNDLEEYIDDIKNLSEEKRKVETQFIYCS